MGAALALGRDLEKAGVIAAALLAATAVLGPNVRVRAFAAAGALGLIPVLLIAEIWNTPQFRPLRERPAFALALAVAGLAVVAAGAWLVTLRPGSNRVFYAVIKYTGRADLRAISRAGAASIEWPSSVNLTNTT